MLPHNCNPSELLLGGIAPRPNRKKLTATGAAGDAGGDAGGDIAYGGKGTARWKIDNRTMNLTWSTILSKYFLVDNLKFIVWIPGQLLFANALRWTVSNPL